MTDASETSGESVLENIVARPAMYWGNSENHFLSFVAFVSGYQIARNGTIGEDVRSQLDNIIPPDFHEFVTQHYGHQFPHGGYGWTTFIEENSSTPQEALELFLKLRRLYDLQKHKSEPDFDPNA